MNTQFVLKSLEQFANVKESETPMLKLCVKKVTNELISEFRQNIVMYESEFKEQILHLPFSVAHIYSVEIDNKRVRLLKFENIEPKTLGVVLLDFERLGIFGIERGTLKLNACAFWNGEGEVPLSEPFLNAILSGSEILLRHNHFDYQKMQFLYQLHKQNKDELRAFFNRATSSAISISQNVRI
ncbi:hypothetical protein CQA49_08700 [Helicobacter sp. MIT 00-7814]|uniref:hypothetical protein n=1 Tax=unclassified Helicobacter TaxID=2593540 RepID=UPI000E1E7F60|nr:MULTISPECIES: hypothetical protein [unclassified Helicobacter]RDU52128.1 hypothetical protein CQA49_08700 [Helicobacter sp. MIT 00-7814]RDU56775.1 hypothetical protein CQA37_01345 [Helicobacter sp. MIT 99-10781]